MLGIELYANLGPEGSDVRLNEISIGRVFRSLEDNLPVIRVQLKGGQEIVYNLSADLGSEGMKLLDDLWAHYKQNPRLNDKKG